MSRTTPQTIRITPALTTQTLDGARDFILRRTQEDYGYGHQPQWHWDIDAAVDTYVTNPRQRLWVALAGPAHERRIVGTVAIRGGGPAAPPHPPELAARYADAESVAQLVRLMVDPTCRRQGLASELVRTATQFARDAAYAQLYLHTNALVPGALEFWRCNAVQIYDARGTAFDPDPRFATVHFEIPLE